MTPQDPHKTFPLAWGSAALTGMAAVLAGGAWFTLPIIFGESDLTSSAIAFAGGMTWLTAMLALLLVALVSGQGVMPTVAAHFGGVSVRLVLCLASVVWVVRTGRLPASLAIGAMFIFYIPLLLTEVALVGRFLWHQDDVGLEVEPKASPHQSTTEVSAPCNPS